MLTIILFLINIFVFFIIKKDESQGQSDIEVNHGRKEQKSEPGLVRKDSRSKSYSSGDNYESRNRTDIKRMKSVHMDRKLSNSARIATRPIAGSRA